MVRVGLLGGCLCTSGCLVPQDKYDRAVERMNTERSAREYTLQRLEASDQQVTALRSELAETRARAESQEAALSQRENQAAASSFELQQLQTERDDHAQRVDQLRGELARVGDHLRVFSEQKGELQEALDAAETRARAVGEVGQRMLLARDVTYALHDVVESDRAAIGPEDAMLVVRFPRSELMSASGEGLTLAATQIFHRLAAAVAPFERARLGLRAQAGRGGAPPGAILEAMRDALVEAGVPRGTITIDVAAAPPSADERVAAGDGRSPDWHTGAGSVDVAIDLAPPRAAAGGAGAREASQSEGTVPAGGATGEAADRGHDRASGATLEGDRDTP